MSAIIEPFEKAALAVGAETPLKRFFFGTSLAAAAVLATKPRFAFDGDEAKEWSVTNPEAPGATMTPWWLVSATVGAAFATFI